MSKITYTEPLVKLIRGNNSSIGFFVWMKSRMTIINDKDGNKFMTDLDYSDNWMDSIPKEFYAGGELVNKHKYFKRIIDMDLQYNGFDYYVFEINGSCLFRDLLFNIESVKKWATSNRFKFNLLEGDSLHDYKNYPVSSEYSGLKDWEDALHNYIKVAGNDDRSEMPLSISSHFWVGIDYKLLINFLSLLKHKMPFFYKVYGIQFIKCLKITEKDIPSNVSPDLMRYYLKDDDGKDEVNYFDNYVYTKTDMALILYSQFLRQSSSTITGYYDVMTHSSVDDFKNKVFLGKTAIRIGYLTTKDKLYQTLSNRCCAFSMNKGKGNDSWDHIISKFIRNISVDEFFELLPCEFSKSKRTVTNCKFHEDIKFRNEGKEVVACPCPIYNKSMELALRKHKEDGNVLSSLYLDAVNFMVNDSVKIRYSKEVFTSNLMVLTDDNVQVNMIEEAVLYLSKYIDTRFSKFRKDHLPDDKEFMSKSLYMDDEYIQRTGDYTCILKGIFIDHLSKFLEEKMNLSRFIINFGGDIYGHNVNSIVDIKNTKFRIQLSGCWSVFCSGNDDEKRGNHIETKHDVLSRVVVINTNKRIKLSNQYVDYLATKIYSDPMDTKYTKELDCVLYFDKDYKLLSPTYCASPFFNPEQVSIRDRMISQFTDVNRPDLTESSKKYDATENPTIEDIKAVVKDNIDEIENSRFLVFPNNTSDLGTLFEVGVAIWKGVNLIKYDELLDKYTVTLLSGFYCRDFEGKYLFDCSNKLQVISMGIVSQNENAEIYYQLKGAKDNIMLSANYTHIENINGEYRIIERDGNDRDK